MRLVVPFVLACACGLVASPAVAADELGLSKDGTHWSADLASPLFSPSFRWIPGDHETRSFWVRNQSSDRARLDITLVGESVETLMQTGDLALTVNTSSGGHGMAKTVGTHKLVASRIVSVGEKEKVDVTIDFDASSTNQSQVKAYEFHLLVRLTQDSAAGGGDSDNDGDGGNHDGDNDGDNDGRKDRNGILPGTGGPSLWILGAGILGVSAGWLTVAASRRREANDV